MVKYKSGKEFTYSDFRELIGSGDMFGANEAYKRALTNISNAQSEIYDEWAERNNDNETNYPTFISECILAIKEVLSESG